MFGDYKALIGAFEVKLCEMLTVHEEMPVPNREGNFRTKEGKGHRPGRSRYSFLLKLLFLVLTVREGRAPDDPFIDEYAALMIEYRLTAERILIACKVRRCAL